MSRSKRWTELHIELAEWWHKVPTTRGKSLPKGVDSTVAWYTNVDLRSIHTSEYRRADDAEIRAAIREAREATKRLSELLWDRERRMHGEETHDRSGMHPGVHAERCALRVMRALGPDV